MPGISIQDQPSVQNGKTVDSSNNLVLMCPTAQTVFCHVTATSSLAGVWEGTFAQRSTPEADADWFDLPSLKIDDAAVIENLPGATITPDADDVMAASVMGATMVRFRRTVGSGIVSISVTNASLSDIAIASSGGSAVIVANPISNPVKVEIVDGTDSALVTSGGALNTNVTAIVPGTGATNLGKAQGSAAGSTDTGIAAYGVQQTDATHGSVSDGDYRHHHITPFGAVYTEPEQHVVIDEMDSASGWAVLSDSADTLATSTNRVVGTNSLSFNKVNGSGSTLGAIDKTISSLNLGSPSLHDLIQLASFASSTAQIDYIFLRLGTNASNYNEWRIDADNLTQNQWENISFEVGDASHAGATGTGINWTAVTYVAVGYNFDGESNMLSGILFDQISFHTNQHVSAAIGAEVTSTVSSANINLQKVGGSATDKGAGNVSNGSQRIAIATDDVNMAAIKASVEIMDDWDESDRAKVNIIQGEAGIAGGEGADGADVPRFTLAQDVGLPPGTANLGTVDVQNRGRIIVKDIAFTIQAELHSIGDVVADRQTLAAIVSANDAPGKLVGIAILDIDDNAAADMDLYIIEANVVLGVEGEPISITDGDADKIAGVIHILTADWVDLVNSKVAVLGGDRVDLAFKPNAGTDDVFVALVTKGTPTYTTTSSIKGAFYFESYGA